MKKHIMSILIMATLIAFSCTAFAESAVTLVALEEEVQLTKDACLNYVKAAREAYVTEDYADYTTSIIQDYVRTAGSYDDRPNPVSLTWTCDDNSVTNYIVEVSEDNSFAEDKTRTFYTQKLSATVYNLKTETTYYWRVTAKGSDGSVVCTTDASVFKTAEGVRWMNVDGARNIRDIGGWNGLNQGLLYRGSELNAVSGHGLALTGVGRFMAQNVMDIKNRS